MTSIERYAVIFYAFFWLVRIRGCIRRGRQPLLRGRDWFFSVHVPPGFYSGEGRTLLHRYWLRMLIPFAVDIPIAAAIFYSGRVLYLNYLILALTALIHLNHVISVDLAERQARRFAIDDDDQPATRVLSSLKPRRLRDYTNAKLEWAMAITTLFVLAFVIRAYALHSPDLVRWMTMIGFLLYVHAGLLYVKCVIVAWRAPVPQAQAAEHLEVREETRRRYLQLCDLNRISVTAAMLLMPLSLAVLPAAQPRLLNVWLATWLVLTIAGTVWGEIRRTRLAALTSRVRPAKLPDLLQSDAARWPLCY